MIPADRGTLERDPRAARAGRFHRARGWVRRHPTITWAAGILGIGFIVFVLVWFQPQKLFLNKTVNESLPGVIQTNGAAPSLPAPSTPARGPAALRMLASGSFRSLEHSTSGRAVILEGSDGTLILRLVNLDTSNGPDLRVFLSEIPAGDDLHAYGERFVDLGALKGNQGSQNYAIPGGTDIARFRSAVIWCRRFKVGFGAAPLQP